MSLGERTGRENLGSATRRVRPRRVVVVEEYSILAFTLIISPKAQSLTMIRSEHARIDAKRRSALDPKKRQFAQPFFQQQDYKHRLSFYTIPPTEQITLEEFEEWAISRLKSMEITSMCSSLFLHLKTNLNI